MFLTLLINFFHFPEFKRPFSYYIKAHANKVHAFPGKSVPKPSRCGFIYSPLKRTSFEENRHFMDINPADKRTTYI